jgi:hypothetical protein
LSDARAAAGRLAAGPSAAGRGAGGVACFDADGAAVAGAALASLRDSLFFSAFDWQPRVVPRASAAQHKAASAVRGTDAWKPRSADREDMRAS